MDGQMDRRMDGWTDRWADGWMDRWTEGWMDGWEWRITICIYIYVEICYCKDFLCFLNIYPVSSVILHEHHDVLFNNLTELYCLSSYPEKINGCCTRHVIMLFSRFKVDYILLFMGGFRGCLDMHLDQRYTLQELVPSFYHVGSRDWAQVFRFGGKCHPLSHLLPRPKLYLEYLK